MKLGRRWVFVWLAVAALCTTLPVPGLSDALADPYNPSPNAPDGTPAYGDLETVDANGNVIKCSDATDNKGVQLGQGALIGKIMPCMTHTIETSTLRFTEAMVSTFRPLLYSFLALVVVLFGVRVLQNEPQIYKQGFILVLKLTIVLVVLNDLGGTRSISNVAGTGDLIPAVYRIMNESQTIVTGALPATLSCDVENYNNAQDLKLWSIMDCVMGKLFGYTVGTDGKGSMLLATSMFGLLAGFFFGGSWGIVIFFGMLGVLFGLFMLVVRTIAVFINSYLVICLMLIVSPLLMPLVFLKATEQYFEKFWKNILAAFVAPIIVTSYVMLALMVYDKMLFAPNSLVQALFKWDLVEKAMESNKTVAGFAVTGDATAMRVDPNAPASIKDALMKMPSLQNFAMPTLSGAGSGSISVPSLNMSKLGTGYEDGKLSFERIFNELIMLFILAWLVRQGLNRVELIVAQLAGSRSVTKSMEVVAQFEKQTMDAGQSAAERMRSAFNMNTDSKAPANYAKGDEFVSRSKDAASAGMGTFMDKMKKK